MTATLRPVGMLKTYTGGRPEISVEAGQTVRQALQSLGFPSELVALVLVNDAAENKEYCLKDGDEVRLLAVIGGG